MATSSFPTICLTLGLGLALPSLAFAAPPEDNIPKGTAGQDDASSGSTELGTGDKFVTNQEVGPEAGEGEGDPNDPHANDATEFDIALGGIFNTGNSQNLSATSVSNFRLRRTIHQFGASVAGNFGAAVVEDDGPYEPNVGNVQGLARYDIFFAKRWTAFLQYTGRHDPFQLLTYRMNLDPGFAFYALNKPNHRLWFEAGYDFQYDYYDVRSRYLVDPETGFRERDPATGDFYIDATKPKDFKNHAARLFAAYSNKLSPKVSFDTSLEYLQSFIEADRLRLNYLAGINTQLAERFSLAVTFTLRFDNKPITEDVKKLDTITAVSLAYRFF